MINNYYVNVIYLILYKLYTRRMEYSELLRNFGVRLKYYRNVRNMTQEELAEKVGSDIRYLSNVECGKRNITFKTLYKFCDALNITPVNLFSFD